MALRRPWLWGLTGWGLMVSVTGGGRAVNDGVGAMAAHGPTVGPLRVSTMSTSRLEEALPRVWDWRSGGSQRLWMYPDSSRNLAWKVIPLYPVTIWFGDTPIFLFPGRCWFLAFDPRFRSRVSGGGDTGHSVRKFPTRSQRFVIVSRRCKCAPAMDGASKEMNQQAAAMEVKSRKEDEFVEEAGKPDFDQEVNAAGEENEDRRLMVHGDREEEAGKEEEDEFVFDEEKPEEGLLKGYYAVARFYSGHNLPVKVVFADCSRFGGTTRQGILGTIGIYWSSQLRIHSSLWCVGALGVSRGMLSLSFSMMGCQSYLRWSLNHFPCGYTSMIFQ